MALARHGTAPESLRVSALERRAAFRPRHGNTVLVAALLAAALACSGGSADPEGDAVLADAVPDATDAIGDLPDGTTDAAGPGDVDGADVDGQPDAATDSDGRADAVTDAVEDADAVASDTDSGATEDVTKEDAPEPDAEPAPVTAAECFSGQSGDDGALAVDYDGLGVVMGSHCMGTNHQDISGVERVVFAGDSITVGTPPTLTSEYYRNRLAQRLASRFGLEAPGLLWQTADVINGVSVSRFSGDFASCAKWGARTDDITNAPHRQIQTCAPEEERNKVTLFVMTVGGNDFFKWAQDLVDGASIESIQEAAEKMVADMEASVRWVVDDPSPFPNGAYVVFATNFEFTDTDSANDFATCPGAGIISMDTALVDPELNAIGAWVLSEYVRIAVETGTDVIFMGEGFCGHGHMRDNPDGRCYRGPGAELWLDITCMHPSAAGHAGIAEMFMAVIEE